MITLENLPPRHLAQPMATLVASLDPGAPAPLHSLPLSFKFHEQPTLTLLHLAGPALPSPHPLLTAPLSRSPSDILHVVAHSNSIFPSFVTLDTLYSMLETSRPTQNITLQVPYGTTNHGDPDSFCIPPTRIGIASFLMFNYIALGATVVSYPGELCVAGQGKCNTKYLEKSGLWSGRLRGGSHGARANVIQTIFTLRSSESEQQPISCGSSASESCELQRCWPQTSYPRCLLGLCPHIRSDRKSTRLNSSHLRRSRMPSSA